MKRPRSLSSVALMRLAAIVALTAAAFLASNAFAATPTVGIGSITRGVGQQGTLSLRATGLGNPALGAWTVDVSYNPAVVSITSCDPQFGGLCNPNYGPSTLRNNGVRINGIIGDVTLVTITFSCLSAGTSDLSVSISVFADTTPGAPQPIGPALSNGAVTCTSQPQPEGLLGDVDCDGDIDAIDAALVLQFDAGLIHSLPCALNGDLNHDGAVNSIDGTIILQIAAGLI